MSISVREDDRVPASRTKVSVVVQFLNAARKLLEDAVRNMLWQTFTEWELVLVDGVQRMRVPRLPNSLRNVIHAQLASVDTLAWNARNLFVLDLGSQSGQSADSCGFRFR